MYVIRDTDFLRNGVLVSSHSSMDRALASEAGDRGSNPRGDTIKQDLKVRYSAHVPMPTFSVVIPTKNEEQALKVLLNDLKEQTVQPHEVIVADAASTDATPRVAEQHQAKLVPGGLPGVGRNAGAAQASGEIIIFLDADVRLTEKHFFERTLNEFTRRNLDLATSDIYPMDPRGRLDKLGNRVYNRYVRLWGARHPHTPGFFIVVKKTIHQAIAGFDPTVIFLEDHDYGYRAVKKAAAKFAVLNSIKIGVTMRRFNRDGRLFVTLQYILAEIHYFIFGAIRHHGFRYRFGYPAKNKKR